MNNTADVIVIGAGVHGASLAFHLAQRGVKVILLEKRFVAAGATGSYALALSGSAGAIIAQGISLERLVKVCLAGAAILAIITGVLWTQI